LNDRLSLNRTRAEVIVRKTIEIGHELRMKVVAEGVETPEQFQLLKKLNCDVAQGYLFARPMPANALLAWQDEATAVGLVA